VYPVITASGTSTSGTGVGVGAGVGDGVAVGLAVAPSLDGDGFGWSLRQALRRSATPTMASGLQRRDGIGPDGSRT
jgi:hypothetical protein